MNDFLHSPPEVIIMHIEDEDPLWQRQAHVEDLVCKFVDGTAARFVRAVMQKKLCINVLEHGLDPNEFEFVKQLADMYKVPLYCSETSDVTQRQ